MQCAHWPGCVAVFQLPVTIGNIIGGGFFICAVRWFVRLRRSAAAPVRRLMTKGPPAVSADTARLSEAMRSPLLSVDVKASVCGIYRTLAEKRIRHIVIMEDGE